jgi:RNA polymerase sigma-70 factor (ECF subfamily)
MMQPTAAMATPPWLRICEGLWQEFADRLLLLARALLGDDAAAEDALQNLFARLIQSEGSIQFHSAGPYLMRAIRNEALNLRRSRRRHRRREEAAAMFEAVPGDPARSAEKDELRRRVERALRELPEELREAVVLKVWSGLTLAEAAGVAELPVKSFEQRYYEALRRLRERMAEHA